MISVYSKKVGSHYIKLIAMSWIRVVSFDYLYYLDTFFGKFTTSPAPANVGLQDGMDIILLVINNIGRERKGKKIKDIVLEKCPN